MNPEDLKERIALRSKASLPYWWERTRDLNIPQPTTEYIPQDGAALIAAMDGHPLDVEPVRAAADRLGYPVFLRTDVSAAKHSYKDTCLVKSPDDIGHHMFSLLDEGFANDMLGEATPGGFAVREFLQLDWSFKAFWGEMPIATEVRVFVRDGVVECVHPYWPAEAIQKFADREAAVRKLASKGPDKQNVTPILPADWQKHLAFQNSKIDRDIMTIHHIAEKVARVMEGWWSCDLALAVDDRTWYLIDMAPGKVSYHLPSCGHALPVPEL